MKKTQLQKVKDHLELYGSITTMCAFNRYGITRLSEHIRKLRNEYYWSIPDEWICPFKGNRYKVYKFKNNAENKEV